MPWPGLFTHGKEPLYSLYRQLSGPQSLSGRVWNTENFLSQPESKARTVQPVASRYPGPIIEWRRQ
jgi:hypothetical protein